MFQVHSDSAHIQTQVKEFEINIVRFWSPVISVSLPFHYLSRAPYMLDVR